MIGKIALALSVAQAIVLGTLYMKYRKPLRAAANWWKLCNYNGKAKVQ